MFLLNNLTVALNQDLVVRLPSPLVPVSHPLLEKKEIRLWMKREDLIHPEWGGNKYRKLKYNLQAYNSGEFKGLVTFGGLHSNHIYAIAAATRDLGISAHGIIRGHHPESSPTLDFAQSQGMQIHRVDWGDYKFPDKALEKLGLNEGYYMLPEGGTNALAIQGCAEIADEIYEQLGYWPDRIACSFGTGGTAAGIAKGLKGNTELWLIPAVKGDWVKSEMECLVGHSISNVHFALDYHFGGYANVSPELLDFIKDFFQKTSIALDVIYTGKLLFGIFDLINKDQWSPGSSLVVIHSGGLQGNLGFNQRFGTDLPVPDYILR